MCPELVNGLCPGIMSGFKGPVKSLIPTYYLTISKHTDRLIHMNILTKGHNVVRRCRYDAIVTFLFARHLLMSYGVGLTVPW